MNASNQIEIRNWVARFALRADDRYVAKNETVIKGERESGERRMKLRKEREKDNERKREERSVCV